jgi:hypothetical protein
MVQSQEMARVILGPQTPMLTAEDWAEMYAMLWQALDRVAEQNEHLKLQLLFFAGSDNRWPN